MFRDDVPITDDMIPSVTRMPAVMAAAEAAASSAHAFERGTMQGNGVPHAGHPDG
jgi:hypothetical protein